MLKVHVAVRIAVCFLFIFLPLQSMDEWFYDRFFQLRGYYHEHPTPFVLIRVNSASLLASSQREKYHFPLADALASRRNQNFWYPQFYEKLLDQIEKDKPDLVVFTTYFDGVNPPKAKYTPPPNVLFSAYLNEESKLIPPPAPLVFGDNYGFVNVFPDPDNIVRRTNLVYSSGAALAVLAYHQVNAEPIKRNLLDPLFIDYRGPTGSYPTYDASEVLDGTLPPGTLDDKIVLIAREGGRHWDYDTPLGKMSRMEIQANIMDTFLNHREIHILPRIVTRFVAGGAVLLSVLIILYFPLTLAWIFLLLQSVLILLLALFFFSVPKIWAGVANPIFCIFATHLLMLGYKLSRQEEQQWKIQQEAEYLKEMDQFKNNFISLFSHDLKTPIAKIKAITDRLLTEHPHLEEDVKTGLRALDRTNSELARFISDILKVTKMESMRLEPSKEVIDINRLVEESAHRLKFMADEKKIKIVLDLEPLFSMEGDQNLIQEVITNLVENAIKYSPAQRQIIVRTCEDDGRVRVEVIDEGEGIPPDELPRVTGKFYRGKRASQNTKGSGLGLYLSKYFVELHQGELELKSELGKGTKVSFWLPLTP